MGLDMYLTRKSSIWGKFNQETKMYETSVKVEGMPLLSEIIKPREYTRLGMVDVICEEAAYWRKANQIHNWFVQNVQSGEDECNTYDVSVEQLQELVDTCKKVLADHELAEELLPSASGFFFGGTEYDEYYFGDLQNTIDQLEPLIAFETNELNKAERVWVSYEYRSSW